MKFRPTDASSSSSTSSKQGGRTGNARGFASDDDESAFRKNVHGAFKGGEQKQGAITNSSNSNNNNVGVMNDLFFKLQMCFEIFFPHKHKELTPKEEVKRRLRMVLVADRCGMSPGGMHDLKKTVAKALQDFVDIDSEESIQVEVTADPALGTVYAVRVPVRRVKPEVRFGADGEGLVQHHDPEAGVMLEWDPTDFHSSPAGRFPMGC